MLSALCALIAFLVHDRCAASPSPVRAPRATSSKIKISPSFKCGSRIHPWLVRGFSRCCFIRCWDGPSTCRPATADTSCCSIPVEKCGAYETSPRTLRIGLAVSAWCGLGTQRRAARTANCPRSVPTRQRRPARWGCASCRSSARRCAPAQPAGTRRAPRRDKRSGAALGGGESPAGQAGT